MEKIRILNFSVGKEAEIMEINNDITKFEELVGGYVQISKINDGLCIICNDLRKTDNLPYQSKYDIQGNFLVAKVYKDTIVSIDKNSINEVIENIHESTSILV